MKINKRISNKTATPRKKIKLNGQEIKEDEATLNENLSLKVNEIQQMVQQDKLKLNTGLKENKRGTFVTVERVRKEIMPKGTYHRGDE